VSRSGRAVAAFDVLAHYRRIAPAGAAGRGQGRPAAALARCSTGRDTPGGPGRPERRVPELLRLCRRQAEGAEGRPAPVPHGRRQAIRLTAHTRFKVLAGGKLRLPKIGDVPGRWSRPLPSEPSWVAGRSCQLLREGRAARRTWQSATSGPRQHPPAIADAGLGPFFAQVAVIVCRVQAGFSGHGSGMSRWARMVR
jgi:hypothetical protein